MVCLSSWDIAVYQSLRTSLNPRPLLQNPLISWKKGTPLALSCYPLILARCVFEVSQTMRADVSQAISCGATAGFQRPAPNEREPHLHETLFYRLVTAAGNCPQGDTRHASLLIIKRCPCRSLAWNFSFVLIGQPSSLSLSVRIVHIYIWGLSF